MMDAAKRERLEKAGFRIGTVAEFLGLTQEESDLIEIKLSLTDALNRQRKISGLSQVELADKIGSSQSRIAKMERGDPHVSLDLMTRALLATGMIRGELAEIIGGKQTLPATNGAGRRRAPKTPAPRPQAVKV